MSAWSWLELPETLELKVSKLEQLVGAQGDERDPLAKHREFVEQVRQSLRTTYTPDKADEARTELQRWRTVWADELRDLLPKQREYFASKLIPLDRVVLSLALTILEDRSRGKRFTSLDFGAPVTYLNPNDERWRSLARICLESDGFVVRLPVAVVGSGQNGFVDEVEVEVFENENGTCVCGPHLLQFGQNYDCTYQEAIQCAWDVALRESGVSEVIGVWRHKHCDLSGRHIRGGSAGGALALAFYRALKGQTADRRLVVIASLSPNGELEKVHKESIPGKVAAICAHGDIDTIATVNEHAEEIEAILKQRGLNGRPRVVDVSTRRDETPSLRQLSSIHSQAAQAVLDYLSFQEGVLLHSRSAIAGGRVGDGGIDLRLKQRATRPKQSTSVSESGWLPELVEYLRSLDLPPEATDEGISCRSFFSDVSRRGVSMILADGGAGKSFSTLREIARLAGERRRDLDDHNADVTDAWDLPIWIRASTLARICLGEQNLSPLDVLLANPLFHFIDSRASGRQFPLLDAFIVGKIRAGQVIAVVDGVNELSRDGVEARQVRAFQSLLRSLVGGQLSGARKGRVILTCRPEAWDEQLEWIPTELFDSAELYQLERLSNPEIDEYVRLNALRTTTANWTEFFEEWPPVKQACDNPLALALTLSSTPNPIEQRAELIPIAGIFDGAIEAFLRGRWQSAIDLLNDRALLEDNSLGFHLNATSDERRLFARELLSMIAWQLYKSLNGTTAFGDVEWTDAFQQSLQVLEQSGIKVRSDLKAFAVSLRGNSEQMARVALGWRTVFVRLGFLIQENTSFRFLHEALYQFIAASGLALLVPKSGWRRDPWKTAFSNYCIQSDWIESSFADLFCLLPSAYIAWMNKKGRQSADNAVEFSRRLTLLCACVRRATKLDFSGRGIVVRLAFAASCKTLAPSEKRRAVKEAIALFRLDHYVFTKSDGNMGRANLGHEHLVGIERRIRAWLRPLTVHPATAQREMRKLILGLLAKRLRSRKYGIFPIDVTAAHIVGVCDWLRAVEADEQEMINLSRRIDRALPQMSIPERAELLESVTRVTRDDDTKASPGTFSTKYTRDLARRVWVDTSKIVSLPHGHAALDLWPSEMRRLLSVAHPEYPMSSNRPEMWEDVYLQRVWIERGASVPRSIPDSSVVLPRYAQQFRALLTSAGMEASPFFLWLKIGYFFMAPNRADQMRVRLLARFLLRKHASSITFHIMAYCATLLRANRARSLVDTHLTALEADFAALRPTRAWPITSRLLRLIRGGIYLLTIGMELLPFMGVAVVVWLLLTRPHLFK